VRDQTLVVLDAPTRDFIRESTIGTCPPGFVCTVATFEDGELAYVYLGPPSQALVADSLGRTIESIPQDALAGLFARPRLRANAQLVSLYLRAVENAPTEALRQLFLRLAERPLGRLIGLVDGCATSGAADGNDLVVPSEEQAGVQHPVH
jgi:hypothetical protein